MKVELGELEILLISACVAEMISSCRLISIFALACSEIISSSSLPEWRVMPVDTGGYKSDQHQALQRKHAGRNPARQSGNGGIRQKLGALIDNIFLAQQRCHPGLLLPLQAELIMRR